MNIGASSAGKLSKPARAALRQANRCCGEMSCRRATSDTTAPAAYDSATIRPLASSLHRRRRPATDADIDTASRPRSFNHIVDHICDSTSRMWATSCRSLRALQGGVRGPLTIDRPRMALIVERESPMSQLAIEYGGRRLGRKVLGLRRTCAKCETRPVEQAPDERCSAWRYPPRRRR